MPLHVWLYCQRNCPSRCIRFRNALHSETIFQTKFGKKNGRFQLIAGERRLRAIKDYTEMTTIQAKIADIDDLQARRISAAENLLREDLSAIETIEATIEIIDVEMGKEPEYLTVGETPLERVVKLLSKLHSINVSKDKRSLASKETEVLLNKFVQQVESIFKNLPKPLKWQPFLMHDLILLTDIPSKVQKASVKHCLNKALARLEQLSGKVFHEVTQKGSIPFKGQNNNLSPALALNEFSAREIQTFAEDLEKTKENDLVFDPLAGGGLVADTCLAFNRRCWSFDFWTGLKQDLK